jgi:2-phospho-L-lactate guanylyltransferase
MAARNDPWSLVIPVKRLAVAKSRIELPPRDRADLAIAMATDTVAAAAACVLVRRVIVVTDDRRAASALAGAGVVIVPDEPDAGLNPALRHGALAAGGSRVAALSADLPALTAVALEAVLAAAAGFSRGVVADQAGTGTTVLTASSAAELVPKFGATSFQAHRDAKAVDLTPIAAASVRRDVDTLAELRDAMRLGVGPATEALVARLREQLG